MRNIIILFFVVMVNTIFAETISGIVIDQRTKNPLPGVNVAVRDAGLGAVTDYQGGFVIKTIPAGSYDLSVSLIGYRNRTIHVTVDSVKNTLLEIKLTPTLLAMQPVEVTGQSYRDVLTHVDLKSAALAVSTTIIPRQDIRQQQAKTLVDALHYVPSAVTETRGRKVKQFFSFRGQRYPYPDYAVDGIWQKEFLELPYFFSAQDLESVEIVRSSAILLTGLSSMAGVINFKTRDYETRETHCGLEYGSFNSFRSYLSHGAKINTVSYSLGAGYYKTEGPVDKHGAEQTANFFGKVKWQPRSKLKLQSSIFYIKADRQFLAAEPPADSRYWLIQEEYNPLNAFLITLDGYYGYGDHCATEVKASYADRQPHYASYNTTTQETSQYVEKDREWNVNFIQAVSPFINNTIRLGLFYNHWIAPNGKRFYYGKACDTETYSTTLIDEHHFGRLTIDAGVRWEKTHLNRYGAFSINESTKGLTKVTPVVDAWQNPILMSTLGAVYYFSDTFSLHLNSALGQVKPRPGTLTVTLTEPLQENQFKLDFGAQKSFAQIGRFSVTSFYTRQHNAIVLSGAAKTIGDRVMELYLNRDQFQTGVEGEWRSAPWWNNWRSFVNATWLLSKSEQNGLMQRNEEYPQRIAAAGITYTGSRLGASLYTKYLSEFKSSQFLPAINGITMAPQPLGDFVSLDAVVTCNVLSRQQVQFIFEVRNITDERFATSIGYPDFGKRYQFGINTSF